ncbi:MAG: type I methionyl aminopeptidase [Acidimicrobiales bacterium]
MKPTVLKSNDLCWCGSGKKYKRCHKAVERPPAARPVRAGKLSPWRTVPPEIGRPPYAETGKVAPRTSDREIKTPEQLTRMRAAGAAAAEVLMEVGAAVAVGVTTDELDRIGHEAAVARSAYPSTLNYNGYPKSLCTSINEVICHGIPDDRPLAEGDIVNVDVTVFVNGVHGDTSCMFTVGEVDETSQRLIRVTRESMFLGIEAVAPGQPVNVIGRAIEDHATAHDLGVVRAFIGHGIGEAFHTGLQIPHGYEPSARTILEPGMTFTIEPMLTIGSPNHLMWDDGWTAVTVDGSRSAQFEHTIVVTDDGADLLTVTPDGRSAAGPWQGLPPS